MPISGTLDPRTQIFRTTLVGRVTLTDLNQHIVTVRRLRAHEYPGLVDARGVHSITFTARELKRFAYDLKGIFSGGSPAPRAVVVDGLVYFGMARLFATLVSGWLRIAVFEDIATAESWLTGLTANTTI